MGAGKSTKLIQLVYNHRVEAKQQVLVFNYEEDNRYGNKCSVTSRIGISLPCKSFGANTNFLDEYKYNEENLSNIRAIFVDEAQFLTKSQVLQLAKISAHYTIEVHTFGLRSDFQGNLFEGSAQLLGIADRIEEIESVDATGKKATMQIRVSPEGTRILEGPQKEIGFHYQAVNLGEFLRGIES